MQAAIPSIAGEVAESLGRDITVHIIQLPRHVDDEVYIRGPHALSVPSVLWAGNARIAYDLVESYPQSNLNGAPQYVHILGADNADNTAPAQINKLLSFAAKRIVPSTQTSGAQDDACMPTSEVRFVWYPHTITYDQLGEVLPRIGASSRLSETNLLKHRAWWAESLNERLANEPKLKGRLTVHQATEYPDANSLFPLHGTAFHRDCPAP